MRKMGGYQARKLNEKEKVTFDRNNGVGFGPAERKCVRRKPNLKFDESGKLRRAESELK